MEADRSEFPLTIREILRRRRLTEESAEELADAQDASGDTAQDVAHDGDAAPPEAEPAPTSTPNEQQAELERLRAENEELRRRAESAERQLRAGSASRSTRWSPVTRLPSSDDS